MLLFIEALYTLNFPPVVSFNKFGDQEAIGAFEISPQESQAPPEARRYH